MNELESLRFPIGAFDIHERGTPESREQAIGEIAEAPEQLRRAVSGLDDAQLDTVYRPGGWTLRQVVHHLPDSHLNSYVRFKLALTEEVPTIRPYAEDRWGELVDARKAPVELSLDLLASLHGRWVFLLRAMEEDDFRRRFAHPELGELSLSLNTRFYAWHGRHHTAHITALRERMGW